MDHGNTAPLNPQYNTRYEPEFHKFKGRLRQVRKVEVLQPPFTYANLETANIFLLRDLSISIRPLEIEELACKRESLIFSAHGIEALHCIHFICRQSFMFPDSFHKFMVKLKRELALAKRYSQYQNYGIVIFPQDHSVFITDHFVWPLFLRTYFYQFS